MSRVNVCTVIAAAALGPSLVLAQSPTSVNGVWATEGYGLVLDVRADSVTSYEITKVSCIPALRARRAASPSEGALAGFGPPNAPSMFTIRRGSSPDQARVHVPFAASDMIIRRIDRKPAVCDRPTPDTPLSNFDVFAQTWAEQYPFFGDKKADWASIVATNRARVTDSTTAEQLFDILARMIEPFEDAHSSISARSINRRFGGVRRTSSFLAPPERPQGYALVSAHLTTPLRAFCEGQVEFGMLAPDIGYLRIRGFSGYSKDGSFETGLAALEAALDTSFAGAGTWKGLVIDVRLNNGGADPYGIAIARRLTASSYTAYAKQARSDPADPTRWTAEQPSVVQPTPRPGFRGPVVELIGVQSISAAETFTQALLNRTPKVTRVGEPTQGVFSDVLGRTLPNGWRFGLANERFVTNGKSYDHTGISADVTVESFTPAARATGRDAGVERAVAILRGG